MCKYCEKDAKKLIEEKQPFFDEKIDASIWLGASYGEIYCMVGGTSVATAKKIKYCPMCGQKLNILDE